MSDASLMVLDVPALTSAITAVARHRKISMRDVAAETGLSPSSLTRLTQGQKPDADGLLTLLAWLNAEAAAFAVPRDSEPSAGRDDTSNRRPEV
jgi:transcriptional regulator with XRE-family HTH domain